VRRDSLRVTFNLVVADLASIIFIFGMCYTRKEKKGKKEKNENIKKLVTKHSRYCTTFHKAMAELLFVL
jgi:hypothetical protein